MSPSTQAIPPTPPTPADPSPLALALIEALPRLCGGDSPKNSPTAIALAELMGAMAAALERGELELALDGPVPEGMDPQGWPQRHRQALAASPLAVQASALDGQPEAPLVWSEERLRWRRWHLQLETCLEQLIARGRAPLAGPLEAAAVDQAVASAAAQGLDRQQQQAVAALLRHGLVLLGGGPGTGKTSTVVQMLGSLLALRPQLRLHLAAPTGKAAARLRSTLQEGGQRLAGPLAERLGQAPCTTLHRLLESSGERFGRHRRHPLALDLLVVDELSMVDLPLMAALLEALPETCQLLLVGDPAQLPPVGPGAVLQELTQPARLSALGEAAIELKTTYRNNGAIAAFAALLRPGERAPGVATPSPALETKAEATSDPPGALQDLLNNLGPEDNLIWQRHPAGRLPVAVLERLGRHQQRLRELAEAIDWDTWAAGAGSDDETESLFGDQIKGTPRPNAPRSTPKSAASTPKPDPGPDPTSALLAELEACVLLSPVRQGAWGVEAVQRQLLGEAAGKAIQHWPLGTPVLCQRNLAEEGLANGDIGVLVERSGERLVLFPGPFPGQPGAAPGARRPGTNRPGANSSGIISPGINSPGTNRSGAKSPGSLSPSNDGPGARLFHPARLGAAEPALALTIHKSQGSQYQEVLLLVPQTRHWDPRLLYTGLTRARQRAWLITTTAPSWLLAD